MCELKRRSDAFQKNAAVFLVCDQENSLAAVPSFGQLCVIQKNRGSIGEERSKPQPVHPAIPNQLLFASVEIYRRSACIFPVRDNCVAGSRMLQDRVREGLGTEYGVENPQRDVRAFDENDSQSNESPIRSARFSTPAQNPVQPSA